MIHLATTARNFKKCDTPICGRCLLYFDTRNSKFHIHYTETPPRSIINPVPDHCVRAWLKQFVRDQSTLHVDSYYIEKPLAEPWLSVVKELVDKHIS